MGIFGSIFGDGGRAGGNVLDGDVRREAHDDAGAAGIGSASGSGIDPGSPAGSAHASSPGDGNPAARGSPDGRADYAPSRPPCSDGAVVASVEPRSPAHRAGLRPGCRILSAEGQSMRDIIDWFWLSDGFSVHIEFADVHGRRRKATMRRKAMQDWGFEFSDNLFDGVRTCRNSCTFCFMSMLPEGMRSGMYLRDDDYRLSFLQGNFVTLTNMDEDDVQRVIEMGISPLHMSVHALDPDARRKLMGRNHQRGLDAMHELLDAGIDLHMQVVLVPGVNDGAVLEELAEWAVDQEHVLSLGIVPLGFTRYQDRFPSSFDAPEDSLAVIEQMAPIQERSRARNGSTKIHLADEFYVNAYPDDVAGNLPPAEHYDGYPQFHDGIGMLRSLVDDWRSLPQPRSADGHMSIVCGEALRPLMEQLVSELPAMVARSVDVIGVGCGFFGGNVDVSGLLTAQDVVGSLSRNCPEGTVLLPEAMFNSDGLTLDNVSAAEISREISRPVRVICYSADCIFESLGPS